NGDLDLSLTNGSVLTVLSGLVLNGTLKIGDDAGTVASRVDFGAVAGPGLTLSGNATVVFGGSTNNVVRSLNNSNDPPNALTFASTVLVKGKSGSINSPFSNGFIINKGTIQADVAGGSFSLVSFGNFRNDGTLKVLNGDTLTLNGTYSSPGALVIDNNPNSTL